MLQKLFAANGKIIIEPIIEETTNAGLVVQASQDLKVAKGKVVEVDKDTYNEFQNIHVTWYNFNKNDIVFYEKMSAFEIKLNDKTYHIVDRRNILATLHEDDG